MRRSSATCRTALGAALFVLAALALAPPAGAAKLVGGREQAAITRAFDASAAHRRGAVVSIRASSIAPAWAVVRWLVPDNGASPSGSTLRLQSAFYMRVGGRELARRPPPDVRADLTQDLRVAIVYRGSGGETVGYQQDYHSACAGAGDFTDTEQDTVSPMSWTVRYVVDLDDIQAAVRTPQGTVLVPSVVVDGAASTLDAVQRLSRTVVDVGCNGSPVTYACTTTYRLTGAPALSFVPDLGLQVGLALTPVTSGTCDPNDYTLGPSLFDGGATTAIVGSLDLAGGPLPADPYAPVPVSWPGSSAGESEGFVTSPCSGITAVCHDNLHWRGTVTVVPLT